MIIIIGSLSIMIIIGIITIALIIMEETGIVVQESIIGDTTVKEEVTESTEKWNKGIVGIGDIGKVIENTGKIIIIGEKTTDILRWENIQKEEIQ